MNQLASRYLRVAVAAVTILCATTACGGSRGTAAATDQQPQATGTSGPTASTPTGAPDFPGAAGEIADIDGTTLQVQNPVSGQVAVSYTGSTTITAQVSADATDLDVGDCVMVSGEGDDTLAATSVRITPTVDGSCAPSVRGGPRPAPGQAPPSGMPADPPGDGPDRIARAGAFGRVTAIGDDGFTVESSLPGRDGTTTRDVTTSSKTRWTDTVESTAAALEVGKCVVAEGTKDSTGAVTAESIAVSDKVDGQCLGGVMRRVEGGQP